MAWTKNRRQAALSWLFVCALFLLCGILGALQYRSIGDLSVATRKDLKNGLLTNLNRLSQDFNAEIAAACQAVVPADLSSLPAIERDFAARYAQWRTTARHGALFHRIAFAEPLAGGVVLRAFDPATGSFSTIDWPAQWASIRDSILAIASPDSWRKHGAPAPQRERGPGPEGEGTAFGIPLFRPRQISGFRGPFPRPEAAWMIFDLDQSTLASQVLPELVQRHLESGGELDYQVEVLTRAPPQTVIYRSDANLGNNFAQTADASVRLFDPQVVRMVAGVPGAARGPAPMPWEGRWQIYARHRSGSLETVVESIRRRNLAVTAGILLLLLVTVVALANYTRRAQRLAELQMDFVAGVSHELRTPLTAIHTAAYNLRGKVAQNPAQVERYGQLIQQKSGRLKELVEQVLQFAGSKAGRVIQEREPISVESVILDAVEASRAIAPVAQCNIETKIEPGLPAVLGDPLALKQVLENLIGNAAKYGAREEPWIGVSAARNTGRKGQMVEIRVADRGPGIPKDEQARIFEPFFRGRRAFADQVQGTGLGLSLAERIVEAHGGSIHVKSEPMKGAEFILRLPVAPAGAPG
ncbi:MAG: sensor histidine kinase [Bryobacteraceae bacterium]